MRISTFEGQGEAGTGGTRQRDQLSRVERVEWGIPGGLSVFGGSELPDRSLDWLEIQLAKVVKAVNVKENLICVNIDVFHNVTAEIVEK